MRRLSLSVGMLLALLGASSSALSQPITHIGDRAASCVTLSTGPASHVLTLNGAIGAGLTVILSVAVSGNSSNISISFPFDSVGNSYSGDETLTNFSSFHVLLLSSRLANGLSMGQQITIPYTNSTGGSQTSCAVASVFSNLVPGAGYGDQIGTGTGSTPAMSVTTSGATSQANELVMGAFTTVASTTFMAGAGYMGTSNARAPRRRPGRWGARRAGAGSSRPTRRVGPTPSLRA